MKGINAKRIAALAAGAVLIGASAVTADVMYGSTQLVDQNGQPTVKIVVGSAAAVSDGVAAANIAAAIANEAYKTSVYSAAVSGQATCSAGGSSSGTGACEVSDKKVTLSIEIPGVLGNAYQFKTLITDTVDKTLGNRMNTLSEDNYTSSTTQSDTSTILSPLRGASVSNSKNLFRIGQNEFTGFSTITVKDDQAGGDFTYSEEQGFWVGTGAPGSGVYYDSNSQYRQVIARPNMVAYNMRFLGNDYGIPICTANLATTGNWTSCTAAGTDRSENHRIKIQFLGAEWVISKMTNPTTSLTNTNGVVNGGSIKLAKEAKYDIVNVGGVIDAGTFKLRLADISVATGSGNDHPAIIDILDANDAVVGQIQVTPGETYTYTQTSTGSQLKVHVYRTAPGFTLNAKWAEIAVYTDEITLEDGKRYNNAASDDANWGHVYASLLWKNRDASTSNTVPNSLREVTLYIDDMSTYLGGEDRMVAGTSLSFPKKNSAWRLTYNGLDLTDADYTDLKFRSDSGRTLGVARQSDCNTKNNSYTATFIRASSGTTGAFGGTSDPLANDRVDEFFYDPVGGYTEGADSTQSTTGTWQNSMVFWKPAGCSYYKYANLSTQSPINRTEYTGSFVATGSAIKFETAGADSAAPGLIWLYTNVTGGHFYTNGTMGYGSDLTDVVGEIVLQEDAGKHDAVSHYPTMLRIPILNISSGNWRFKSADSSTATIYYNGINTTDTGTTTSLLWATAYELPLYTERGSKAYGVSLTDVSIKASKKVAQPTFTFAPASAEIGSTGTEEVMKEGDSKTLSNGVKITVKKISETVGSCVASTTGGSPSCTVNQAGVSAKIMPDNTDTLSASVPYKLTSNLVMLDREAPNAGVVITVGGPAVNTVTAGVLQDSPIDFKANSVVVKEMGSKIVVAGYTAADTLAAADEFIAGIKRK